MSRSNDSRLSPIPELTPKLRERLTKIYQEAEAAVQSLGPVCQQSGRCCSFEKYDHQLWLTNLELAYLIEKHGLKASVEPGVCPYQEGGLCEAREGRALGCRVFFCNLNSDDLQEINNRFVGQIAQLAEEQGIELFYNEFLDSLSKRQS